MSAPKWEAETGEEARWEQPGAEGVAAYPYTHTAKTKGKRKFLSFEAGESFRLIKQGQKEWWLAKAASNGDTGYIPVNFLVPLPPSAQAAVSGGAGSGAAAAAALSPLDLSQYGWFHGDVSREQAEALLDGCEAGSFVVRESSRKPGAFSLTVRAANDRCKHMKVVPVDGGVTLSGGTDVGPNLPDLLAHHASSPISDEVGTLVNVGGDGKGALTKRYSVARPAPAPPPAGGPSTTTVPARSAPPPPAATSATVDAPPPPLPDYDAEMEPAATEGRTPARAAPLPPPPAESGVDGMEVDEAVQPAPAAKEATRTVVSAGATTDDDVLPDPTFEADFELPSLEPNELKDEVVQLVRNASGLSFDKSRDAAAVVVDFLIRNVSKSTALGVLNAVRAGRRDSAITDSPDIARLRVVIEELTEMKNDAQQRSWSIYDDSSVIKEYLEEFLGLVQDADPRAVATVVAEYQSVGSSGRYEVLDTLVVYYQMETRSPLRVILLQLFAALGGIDREVFPVLQDSQLPLELVRDAGSSAYAEGAEQRVLYSLLLATMVFSCGLPLPVTHYSTLNETFVAAMSDVIEHTAATETDEQISDQAADLLLSFNLHFDSADPSHNLVMHALGQKRCTVLAQRLLILFNRETDPVAEAVASGRTAVGSPDEPPARNAVLKFLIDIFGCSETAGSFFYTADRNSLVDVAIRELTDREHTDPALLDYVAMLRGLVPLSGYADDEEPHREAELKRCLEEQAAAIHEYMGSLELLEGITFVLGRLR